MKMNLPERSGLIVFSLALAAIALALTGCAGKQKEKPVDTIDSSKLHPKEPEVFHANNDIAMTVRSIVDAISQGQQLDTLTYNFSGVLTDGVGAPLYIDAQGSPGQWEVKVEPDKAVIVNLYLGNLEPDDLRHYIVEEVGLDKDDITKNGVVKGPESAEITDYEFDGGTMHFEVKQVMAENGEHGPLMKILISREETGEEADNTDAPR